jgi:hypothetical protein
MGPKPTIKSKADQKEVANKKGVALTYRFTTI